MTADSALSRAAAYAAAYRGRERPLHPTATTNALRAAFCQPLEDQGRGDRAAIQDLIDAAEPGLVGNTDPGFFAWVMGGSGVTGVAADWLTSIWGQNAAIFQTAPAAAIAEEAVAGWMLDLLDLPRESSVGLVTGATMAGFTCLAAARTHVLANAGHDVEALGLQGAPFVHVFLSDDAHVSNLAALGYLGFGRANIVPVASCDQGLMQVDALAAEMASRQGPMIVLGQAGHINSGGFEAFHPIADLCARYGAWLHVDGAFGLWARTLPEKAALTAGLERADSWSVDGHKWLQLPYDSGFAIVRHADAHRRAMDISAGYLNQAPEDGRNPTEYNPELSRRARGFVAWAVLRALGRAGVRDLVCGHCKAAGDLGRALADIPGVRVLNRVELNQIVLGFEVPDSGLDGDALADLVAARLNRRLFVRTARWRGRTVLRLSVISGDGADATHRQVETDIRAALKEIGKRPGPAQST